MTTGGGRPFVIAVSSFIRHSVLSSGIAPAEGPAKRKGLLKNGLVRVPDVW
jgi:hypothetical protein